MSFYRNTVWFVKGLKEYTRNGYLGASKNFNAKDLEVDATGQSFVITGANSGLGKAAALSIAKKGGTVHLLCRNRERGEEAKTEISEVSGNQNVFLHQLDTSKPKDIYSFVHTFESAGNRVDVLINNAGCMINTRELTEDGLEKNFATNTLGTHILTTALVPLLQRSNKPRVVIVSSGGMLVQNLNVTDLQFEKMKPFDGTMAYAQNKRQQVVMTEQYAKKYPNIHFSSMHPGWSDTPDNKNGSQFNTTSNFSTVRTAMPDFYEKMKTRLRTTEEGADTIIWLALSEAALKQQSGLFYQDRKAVSTHLPLAWTKSTTQQNEQLMAELDNIAARMKPVL